MTQLSKEEIDVLKEIARLTNKDEPYVFIEDDEDIVRDSVDLEEKGLVEVIDNPQACGGYFISLTSKGRKALEE